MIEHWWVYILECGDGSLYTGIARNVAERVEKHNQGKGAKYTRSHLPVKVVYQEMQINRSAALQRESELKKLTRAAKKQLVSSGSSTLPAR